MAETIPKPTPVVILNQMDTGYAVSALVSIVSAYYEIAPSQEEREYAKTVIRGLIDKWLEALSPIPYINGLTGELSKIVRRKLWESVNDLTEQVMERILAETIVFKHRSLAQEDPLVLEAMADTLAVHAVLLLEALHGTWINWNEYPVLNSIIWGTGEEPGERIRSLAAVIAIAFVLATN